MSFIFVSCEEAEMPDSLDGVIKTLRIDDVRTTTALCYGNLTISSKSGKYTFEENGICYSTSPNPTISDFHIIGKRQIQTGHSITTTINPKDGEFFAELVNLQKNITYYVRAYTKSNFGVFYGNEMNFTTLSVYNPYIDLGEIYVQREDVSISRLSWESAKALCENSVIGDFDDWKLPNIDELSTLFAKKDEIGRFQYLKPSDNQYPYYWSERLSEESGYLNYYYVINFHDGQKETMAYDGSYARCIRLLKEPEEPEPNYPYLTVDDFMIPKYDATGSSTWDESKNLCENSVLGGFTDWRMPTLEELAFMYGRKDDIGGFSESSYTGSIYWSSSFSHTEEWIGDLYYYVIDFSIGNQGFENISDSWNKNRCRCIRNILDTN